MQFLVEAIVPPRIEVELTELPGEARTGPDRFRLNADIDLGGDLGGLRRTWRRGHDSQSRQHKRDIGDRVLRFVFLALAVWGAIHPMYYFVSWFNDNGYDLMAMVDAWHVNAASSGLVWDLTIAAVALTIWVIVETSMAMR